MSFSTYREKADLDRDGKYAAKLAGRKKVSQKLASRLFQHIPEQSLFRHISEAGTFSGDAQLQGQGCSPSSPARAVLS